MSFSSLRSQQFLASSCDVSARRSAFALLATTATVLLLSGCGLGGAPGSNSPLAAAAVHGGISGSIHGGQQPIAQATISLYAAGKTGTFSAPRSMLTTAVTSDSGGQFSITGDYACQAGDQVYLLATGGSAGGSPNSAIAMMAALGPCATLLQNAATTFITVNEVSSVGSVFALAPYMNGAQALGSAADTPSTNALAAAFASVKTMVDISAGAAPASSTGNGIVPQTTINSLADSLAACIDSASSGSAGCSGLFQATTVRGVVPTDTLQALINIAKNPTLNTSQIYALAVTNAPFQPSLATPPATFALTVAHPSDVLVYHNDISRDGVQTAEKVLTPANVTSAKFGKLLTFPVDSYLFAQPLYAGGIGMPDGAVHNLVLGATTHATVYAFDADGNNPSAGYLWSVSLVPGGERFVSNVNGFSDYGCSNPPEAGIVGTPVIDRSSQTLYVVVKTVSTSGSNFYQRLHAISLIDGSERTGSPTLINPTFAGTGSGSSGGSVPFNAQRQLERSALLIAPNSSGGHTVWISYASHCDIQPYHGDVLGYDAASLALTSAYNDTPNGAEGGIWMSSGGLAADSQGYIYGLVGNGDFDPSKQNYGDAALKLQPPAQGSASTTVTVADYFTPSNQADLQSKDLDVGGAEAILLDDGASGVAPHLMIASDKNGYVYLLNRDNLGGYDRGTNGINSLNADVQDFVAGGTFIYNFAFYNNTLYTSVPLRAYAFTPGTSSTAGSLSRTAFASTSINFTAPVVSANGADASSILIWSQDTGGILHAFTPSLTEIYNTSQVSSRDAPATFVKFTSPVIANGKVYLSGQGAINVYGPLP